MLIRSIIITVFFLPLFSSAQRPLVDGWNENKIKWNATLSVPCMIRLPNGYSLLANASKRYPVIFSFHGTGEAGSDTVAMLNAGLCKNLSNNGSTTYTHEGSSKTVGSDSPTANDKNGNSREAIVIAAQRSSYGPDPAWFPFMFADATARLRIDSSMVYLYGYSAGNWAASGIIANNTDTTYNRFVTAINSSSGATQDLTWSGVRKIGQRNIPFFVVTGDAAGSDISYREQAIREVDSIDNAVPTPVPLPVHVVKTGQGHCCFDTRAANATTYSALANKNLIQWFFQYANPYATTWTPGNSSPTANAGSDQTITLPTNSVSLTGSGSDADGTITAYQWSYISGPATYTITSPASASTTITGLVQGAYIFRLMVTDNGNATGSDDIQVTVNPASQAGDTIQVNLYGGTNPYSNSAWNNWNVSSSLTSAAFTWSNGSSSTVTAVLTASQGIADNGSIYGGTMCPPEVLRYASFATSNRTLTINNLDPAATYDLEFYASRGNTGNATVFTINSVSDTVITDNNKTITANFSGITPDGNNKIVLSLARVSSATYQYLNGFRLIKQAGAPFARSVKGEDKKDQITLQGLTIYPTVVSDVLYINLTNEKKGEMQLMLYDQSGRVVKAVSFNKSQSLFQQQLNTSSLHAGVYYIVVMTKDGSKFGSTFVKQ